MDKDELREVLKGLRVIYDSVESLKDDLKGFFVSKEAFDIYWEQVNKDLNNLGSKIRETEKAIKDLERHNQEQDLKATQLSTKIATILGIFGGLGGIGAFVLYLLRTAAGG